MRKLWWWWRLCVTISLLDQAMLTWSEIARPPLPVLPIPSAAQLKWQRREIIMFFHFGMNTFTDSEWGTGHESPALFNPTNIDANQWIAAAADINVSLVILTAKHHDGFCLWPSMYTDHTVEKSRWKEGKGDVVREFVDAAKERGVDVGLYLSPWDRHERSYGQDLGYNEFYMAQLQELLTSYGSVSEIWFDGAKGKNAASMTYYFDDWFSMVKQLQNSINIFSDAGPDVRWVGDESGSAGSTCWSPINRTSLTIGNESIVNYLNTGDAKGTDWVPPECDVSIRPGWFWHKTETPKSVTQLLEIYYKSVGRNCVLLLNVPPNSTGLVSETDIKRLKEFHSAIHSIFSENLVKAGSKVKASSQRGDQSDGFSAENVLNDDELTYWAPKDTDEARWIEMKLSDNGVSFNVIRIQEAIWMGQRVKLHEVYADGEVVAQGTTVGHKRLHRLGKTIHARTVRIRIIKSRGVPLISSVGLHLDPFAASSKRT